MLTLRNSAVVLIFSTLTLAFRTPVVAQALPVNLSPITESTEPDPLPVRQGSAKDLSGIRPRNSIIWFGGVGGGDEDNDEVEDSVYEMRQPNGTLPLYDPQAVPIDWDANSGEPRPESVLIPLTRF